MTPTPRKQCADEECTADFPAHRWGRIRTQNAGWFHEQNGRSWCPRHLPSWVPEWRAKKAAK